MQQQQQLSPTGTIKKKLTLSNTTSNSKSHTKSSWFSSIKNRLNSPLPVPNNNQNIGFDLALSPINIPNSPNGSNIYNQNDVLSPASLVII